MQTERAKEGERRVGADQWDVDGWNLLASEAERSAFLTAQPIYERLVTQFPSHGKFWRMYADHMARERMDKDDDIITLYNRAVTDAPTSIELWHSYNAFMTARAVRNSGSPLHETQLIAVHERALSDAGLDVKADVLWGQYFNFLTNHATMSDSQRRDALKRLHQRAVRNPMEQLDVFWRSYTEFENDVATSTSGTKDSVRAILADLQSKNHEARTEWRARTSRRQGITLHAVGTPPRARAKEMSQAQSWRRFIAWERGNAHNLSPNEVHARVVHAFESALTPLYRYAGFWIEYIDYLYEFLGARNVREGVNGNGGVGGGSKNGGKDNKNGNDAGASNSTSSKKLVSGAIESVLERAIRALPDNITMHAYANSVYVRIGKGEKGVSILEKLSSKYGFPLAYIHLMRATWKHDGRDAARKTFSRARKDARAAHPLLYVAAANMEFVLSKDSKIPRNVFEFGLKNLPHNALLALKFVDWLWGTGDTEYARVILKRVTPNAKGSEEEIGLLWERWIEVEEFFGDSASVDSVLKMWKEGNVGRSGGVLQDAVRLSRFGGLEGMSGEELAVMGMGKDGGGSGGDVGSSNGNGGNLGGGNNGGGKRDPRTGRRVDKSATSGHQHHVKGSGKDGGAMNNGMNGLTGGVAGGGGNRNRKQHGQHSQHGQHNQHGQHHPHGQHGGGGDHNDEDDILKVATTWLEKLASTMPPITAPLPGEDMNILFRSLMDTPEEFSNTPAGRANATLPPVTGKKRKNTEMTSNIAPGLQQDVFRTRQAAKQSRLR